MSLYFRLLLVALLGLPALALHGQEPASKPTPLAAPSNGVEIQGIRVVREKSLHVAAGPDLNYMEMVLWFSNIGGEESDQYAVKLVELAAVQDDAGTDLLPAARRAANRYLQTADNAFSASLEEGKTGPAIDLTFDAPAKKATRIAAITGQAVIAKIDVVPMKFDNLKTLLGRPLVHPKLKNFPIKPTMKTAGGKTLVTLAMPAEHSQVLDWGVARGDELLVPVDFDEQVSNGQAFVTFHYEGDATQGTYLAIEFAERSAPQTINFDFRNVELP